VGARLREDHMMPPPKSNKPATASGKPASESSGFGGALKFEAYNPKPLAQAFLDQSIGTPEIAIAEIVIAERHRQGMGRHRGAGRERLNDLESHGS
jgi:hypothetical protein